MPKLKAKYSQPPPAGFDEIAQILTELNQRMQDAAISNEDMSQKSKNELLWPIIRADHQRTRYLFEMIRQRNLPRAIIDYAISEGYVNKQLLQIWGRPGYEKVCCIQCALAQASGNVCMCRVPRSKLPEGKRAQGCTTCGCKGCASTD